MRKSARLLDTSDTPNRTAQPAERTAQRMPLIRLTPHKARVVIEDGAEMILVLKVSLHRSDSVDLASGGRIDALSGMLRIRERGGLLSRTDTKISGKLTFVPETVSGNNRAPPEFQIDVPLGPREFRVLLDLGRAGRLPHKIFVQAGERTAAGPRGLVYRSRNGRTSKLWDNVGHRRLPVTNVTFVVPVESGQAPRSAQRPRRDFDEFDDDRYDDRAERDTDRGAWNDGDDRPREQRSFASSAQVAELADELIVYQSETRHLLTALLIVVGLTAAIVVVAGVLRFLK